LGAVIGDYSRTAINTSIYPGKIIGANSHLYGIITKDVPSFTVEASSLGCKVEFDLAEALKIQKIVLARRGREQSEADRRLLKDIFESTKEQRQMANIKPGKLEFKI
jgi:glucose-1-phosphate thymidylyltransferase